VADGSRKDVCLQNRDNMLRHGTVMLLGVFLQPPVQIARQFFYD
jgi:hypothetical protein